MARTCSYTPALLVAILSLGGVSQGARAQPVDWRGMTSAASARGRAPSRTVGELLGRERDALRSILAEREDARRVRMGGRVARGELLRLETVHNELTRRSQGVAKEVAEREAQLRRRMRALYRLVRGTSRRPLMDPGRSQAAVDGRWLLLRILRRDLGEIGRLKREESKLSEGLEEVVRRRREARAVLSDLERRKDELQARLAQSRQELTELRHLRRNHRGQASEWDAKAFQIEREIVALHLQVNRGPSSFEGQRGTIARPVPGMILT
ncbi:MAG: hypothetical protein RBU30_17485, partial [Polyangia bacterium]|nr:hypothetical protein [Polyangia bacterium]